MATSFKVVTHAVEGLASRMDTVAGNFGDVAGRDVSYGGYADADPVDDGLGEFFGKWTDGMDKIRKKMEALAERLHFAAETYDTTEQSIVEAATPR